MSITSEELNYLIWRYLQETGHEVSALALQEETRVLEFDKQYQQHIALGTLVNLVQRGILYTESELLVRYNDKVAPVDETHYSQDFNLVQALQVDKEKYPELASKGRFELAQTGSSAELTEEVKVQEEIEPTSATPDFIKTLKEVYSLERMTVCEWNPREPRLLACGQKDSVTKILQFNETTWSLENTFETAHPPTINMSTSDKGPDNNEITCIRWSKTGEDILTATESGELRLWDKLGRLKNTFSFHRAAIVSMEWNEDCTYFISTDVDNVTILWDVATGTALQQLKSSEQKKQESLGVDVEWVEKNKFVIPGSHGSILVYQLGEEKPLGKLLGHCKAISCLQFNPVTKLLLSASDDTTIRVWKGGSSNPSNCFQGHSQTIVAASWLDEDKIISASMDGSVRIWSLEKNTVIAASVVDGVPIFAAQLSSDKTRYSVGFMDGQITVFDIEPLVEKIKLQGNRIPATPLTIPLYGNYQSGQEGDCVFDLSWSSTNDNLAIAYSIGKGTIISM